MVTNMNRFHGFIYPLIGIQGKYVRGTFFFFSEDIISLVCDQQAKEKIRLTHDHRGSSKQNKQKPKQL